MTVNTYEDDPRRKRADAQLDMIERVLPGLLGTLELNSRYARLLRAAAGLADGTERPLRASGHYKPGEGEQELNRGRQVLLRAAGVSRRAYEAMHRNSKERSDVLLAGAAKLGIETDWPGWAEYPEWGLVTDYNRGTPLRAATRGEWQRTQDILESKAPGSYTGAWEEDGRAVYVEGGPS